MEAREETPLSHFAVLAVLVVVLCSRLQLVVGAPSQAALASVVLRLVRLTAP